MELSFNSTTGFVPAGCAPTGAREPGPGRLLPRERARLRDLAREVAEAGRDPRQAERRRLWTLHNRLAGERPMIYTVVEAAWREVLPFAGMTVEDPFWRQWEWYLRHLLYRHRHVDDDFVILPVLKVPVVFTGSGWGLEMDRQVPAEPRAHGAGRRC